MGQAFDRDGNVLGEAYGDTKREVFEKLIGEFKDAHEIRIRSMRDERPLAQRLGLMAEAVVSASDTSFFDQTRRDEIVLLLREAEKRILEGS